MKKLITTFFLGILFFSSPIVAKTVVYEGEPIKNFGKEIDILVDEFGKFHPLEILDHDLFYTNETDVINLGVSQKTFWLRFKFKNTTKDKLQLNIPFPILDECSSFIYNENNELIGGWKGGLKYPFSDRPHDYQDFLTDLPASDEELTILIRVSNGSQIIVPTEINKEEVFFNNFLDHDHFFGIYTGFILVMLFYNLFVYLSIRDNNYLLYLFYILTVGFTQLTINGYSIKNLLGDYPLISSNIIYVGGIASGLGVVFFVKSFLQVKTRAPWLNHALNIFAVCYVVAFVFLLFGLKNEAYNTINFTAAFGSIALFVGSIIIAKKGYRIARYFVVAWTIFLASIIVFVLKDFNILPYNSITVYSMPVGSAIEVVVLALALADKLNTLQEATRLSRERELIALKRNEKLIKEQNIVLEQKVEERTHDFQVANDSLNDAMSTLKNAQSQLVSQEKMASLGQLTAGIAHEINNPINFVSSNVSPLRRDIEDLKEIIDKYDELTSEEQHAEIKSILDKLKDEVDYSYVLQEIQQLLDGIQEGAERTAEIVKSLKNFSRLDEIESKFANIHDGIDSTIVILKSGTQGKVEIRTDYDPNIQPIECYPGKMNQVFSNILVNAIQALTETKKPISEPTINITTKDLGNQITISIKDNGPGIPENIKENIFDPFFTTKDVGEGTGLGLSIVFSIIESHRGTIDVNSLAGEGTEFLITLPKAIH